MDAPQLGFFLGRRPSLGDMGGIDGADQPPRLAFGCGGRRAPAPPARRANLRFGAGDRAMPYSQYRRAQSRRPRPPWIAGRHRPGSRLGSCAACRWRLRTPGHAKRLSCSGRFLFKCSRSAEALNGGRRVVVQKRCACHDILESDSFDRPGKPYFSAYARRRESMSAKNTGLSYTHHRSPPSRGRRRQNGVLSGKAAFFGKTAKIAERIQ